MLARNLSLISALVAGATGVDAFPSYANRDFNRRAEPVANVAGLKRIPDSAHPFIAPGPTDQRGPCPGLNTLANHGYLPRSGIVNQAQVVSAVQEGFNMAPDVGNFLWILAVITVGNPLAGLLSIGGPDSRVSLLGGILSGVFGTPGGLGNHLKGIEGDASATRKDYYFGGDDFTFQPELFAHMQSFTGPYGGLFELDALKNMMADRYQNSKTTNPTFYFLPTSSPVGIIAKTFPATLFSNGTYGAGGVPNIESIAPIFGAQPQADGSYARVPERFPPNWYRTGKPLDLVYAVALLLDAITTRNLAFGANAGSTSNFVPYNIDVTKLDANGLACLLRNSVRSVVPSTLATGLLASVTALLGQLDGLFNKFGCPVYNGIGA